MKPGPQISKRLPMEFLLAYTFHPNTNTEGALDKNGDPGLSTDGVRRVFPFAPKCWKYDQFYWNWRKKDVVMALAVLQVPQVTAKNQQKELLTGLPLDHSLVYKYHLKQHSLKRWRSRCWKD